jgi:signal transduction histidine kinase
MLLAREGYWVELASNGREGLAGVTPELPHLIISDITMPEMDGFEFCRRIKSSEATRRVPVILLTSRSSPADIIKGLECGADNFLPKPYDDQYLLERIRRIFEQLELRKDSRLEMEVSLNIGGRHIHVTADRQQIMELLFSTFEEVSRNYDELTRANLELREARAEAERANREKSAFLSRMSHELRTPLNAILGFAQLLEMDAETDDQQESLRHIVRAGRHLLELINEILDIARIESGNLTLSLEPVEAGDAFREAVALVRPLADERGITVSEASWPDGNEYVTADRQRLKQVLLNLLSNAIKYNATGGSVMLSIEPGELGKCRLNVTDTGRGIAAEHLRRLFTPFDRLGAENADVEGTGIGLALSRSLVEMMGGAVGVESALGRGSTFWVDLPVAEDELARAEPAMRDPSLAASPSRESRIVLCIEDNLSSLRLLERVIELRPPVRLLTALQGSLGIDLARQHRPDLILLDLNLPDVHGHEVLQRLRADPVTSGIPVVVLSADATPGQIARLLDAGARDYLTKPIDVQRCLGVLDEVLWDKAGGNVG